VIRLSGSTLFLICCGLIFIAYPLESASSDLGKAGQEDTLLMFVGEDLDVLTIASRREESARQAPAVARSISRKTIRQHGITTLSEVLESMAGFHMAEREWGTQPYLRGIPDSVLFLYDTVSISSDVTKSLHSIDHELSLAGVKRIEIIRGPGSVLWGPDAFAGIVNIVPMSGKDLNGVETGIQYGEPNRRRSFFLNFGHDAGQWDSFVSLSGYQERGDDTVCNVVEFWGQNDSPVPPENRYGNQLIEDSRYYEISGRFSYGDWLTLSGRFADNHTPYAASSTDGEFTWKETKKVPNVLFRFEARKDLDHISAIRFAGSITNLRPEYQVIDRTWNQQERTLYGELIYDRSLMTGRGLFTSGVSYRQKHIENARIWKQQQYLPELIRPENLTTYPIIDQKDYNTTLKSLFGRYTQKIGEAELWIGARYDDHDEYQNHTSVNAGAAWFPSSEFTAKFIVGTAYRTPFARQLLDAETPDLENIISYNLEITIKPDRHVEFTACGFFSQIKNHLIEHPYAGLSQPNNQDITGIEFEGRYAPIPTIEFTTNLTLLIDHSGPNEIYKYNDYTFYRPDEPPEPHFKILDYPYDTGPSTLFNITSTWRPYHGITAVVSAEYTGSRQLSYPEGEFDKFVEKRSPGLWRFKLATTLEDFIGNGMDLEVSMKNLTSRDSEYETPGIYNTIIGEPFSVDIVLRKTW